MHLKGTSLHGEVVSTNVTNCQAASSHLAKDVFLYLMTEYMAICHVFAMIDSFVIVVNQRTALIKKEGATSKEKAQKQRLFFRELEVLFVILELSFRFD